MLFIESTTNARFIIKGSLVTIATLLSPSNLDFEELEDGIVKDWRIQSGQSRLEHETTGSNDHPYKGKTCGMIRKAPDRSFGETFGNIFQTIKAADFRGERIRFTAAVRVTNGTGYLWLSIDNRAKEPDIFQQRIITSNEWQEYSISAEVSQKASKITYGLAYVGQGAAFIDEVAIGNSN